MYISFLKKKKKIVDWICGNGIAEIGGEKKIWLQLVCGNAIAEIEGKFCGNAITENGRKKNSDCRNHM